MEGRLEARESGAGPGMTAEVQGILVTLCFVLILEPVVAVLAGVLLFHFVRAALKLELGAIECL
jgi:hypothetical protein